MNHSTSDLIDEAADLSPFYHKPCCNATNCVSDALLRVFEQVIQ